MHNFAKDIHLTYNDHYSCSNNMVEFSTKEGYSITQSPLIVEREGRRLAVLAFTDLDGTANDETLPERDRLASIGPAIETVLRLQARNIPVGGITGRSFGEALQYQDMLGATGFTICEDGAVIVLPQGAVEHAGRENVVAKFGEDRVARLRDHDVLLLSSINPDVLRELLDRVPNLITTLSNSPEEIQHLIGHPTPEAAALSGERLASCYVADPMREQVDQIHAEIAKAGLPIRTFGWNTNNDRRGPLHLIGTDANKGMAVQVVNDNIGLFLPGAERVDGILPIGFGNNVNDVKLFSQLEGMGGIGVIVGKPGGGYWINEAQIPHTIIKTKHPAAQGMLEAVPTIFQRLGLPA